jgi:hypothetical protein
MWYRTAKISLEIPMRKMVYASALWLACAAAMLQAQTQPAAWPTLQRQLAADRVVAGSALQKLIESNQDFALLRPEEARDKIPVPLWLRVLWHRAHPDASYDAGDPTGGYPHALKEVHEWMLAHQDLLRGLPEIMNRAEPLERIGVGKANQRISGFSDFPRSESDIRVFYGDRNKVIAASNDIGSSGSQAQYWSSNGGATWSQSALPLLAQDDFHTDPTVDWTSDGTAWATTIGIDSFAEALRLRLYKSTDGGATWDFDSTFSGSQESADKQMVWIDHGAASPFRNSIYAIWHNDAPVYMNRRRNGSWGSPIRVSFGETTGTGIGGDVKTNSAGVVFGLWPDTGSRKIFLVRSTNGGASYTKPAVLASTFDSYDIGVPAQDERRALIYVSGGAYKTAAKNLAYAAWTDLSGASGCTAPLNEPGGNAASACKTRIWFARSTDGGLTWGAKKMINNQAGKNDQLNQALAVDEATGTVAIIYYDTVGDATRRSTNVWYQSSYDDGVTWTAPFKVTTGATNEAGGGADLGNQYGDYNSLTGYASTFFPVWTDRRASESEEIWSAALVDVPPVCKPPVAPIGVTATSGTGRIDLAWKAVIGATEYHVYRSTASGGPYQLLASVAAPTLKYANTGLAGGARFFYVVRAYARCESANSAQVTGVAKSR